MDQDLPQLLFEELSAISLFEEKRMIIVREIKKLRAQMGRKELIQYIQSPNRNLVLILISEEYDMKNTFLKQISSLSEFIDLRPPFKDEMKKWVRYILKSKDIRIDDSSLNTYVELYGDSIAHVINEVEKMSLNVGIGNEINNKTINQLDEYDKVFHIWNLQDNIGKKNLQLSLVILKSLLIDGTNITRIIVNIVFLFQQLLWRKMGRINPIGYTGINKIITSRLKDYDRNYSYLELKDLLQELRKIDLLSKSSSLKQDSLLEILLIKICQGINE